MKKNLRNSITILSFAHYVKRAGITFESITQNQFVMPVQNLFHIRRAGKYLPDLISSNVHVAAGADRHRSFPLMNSSKEENAAWRRVRRKPCSFLVPRASFSTSIYPWKRFTLSRVIPWVLDDCFSFEIPRQIKYVFIADIERSCVSDSYLWSERISGAQLS